MAKRRPVTKLDGDLVKQLRESLLLSQEDLCQKTGLKQPWLSEVENNKHRSRSLHLVSILANALNVTPEDLRFGQNGPDGGISRNENEQEQLDALSLVQCQQQYERWEIGVPGDCVLVKCIALDMANGWQHVVQSIMVTHAPEIRMEILVLHACDDSRTIDCPPIWLTQGTEGVETIQREANELIIDKKLLSVVIRGYNEIPGLHGIRAEKNGQVLWWITRCRRIEGTDTWHWGDGEYQRLDSTEHAGADAFDNKFDRLWSAADNDLVSVDKKFAGLDARPPVSK